MKLPRPLAQRLRTTVIVTPTPAATPPGVSGYRGILWEADGGALVLRQAEAILTSEQDNTTAPIDGELLLLLSQVAFIQITGP